METSIKPYRAIKPGEILKDELDARGWTQGDFAEITGKPLQAINEILAGKKAITPETALLFSKALGTTPEFWLNLESAYRLDLLDTAREKGDQVARKARLYSIAPVKELIKRHWIKPSKNIDNLEAEVLSYLGTSALDERPKAIANFRKSRAGVIDTPSLTAWVRKAEIEASGMECLAFDPVELKEVLPDMPKLSSDERGTAGLPERLCRLGIRLVFVPHLPQTRVDGAALWLDNKSPVVALSLRLDRIDNFWFTLVHELVHILDGAKKTENYLDQDIADEPEIVLEKKINQKARDLLIPRSMFDEFVRRTKPYFSRREVLTFAHELGIHPAIVVGRLQYEKLIPYTNLRNLMSRASILFKGTKRVK